MPIGLTCCTRWVLRSWGCWELTFFLQFGGDLLEKALLVAAEEVDFSDEKMVDLYKSMVTGEFSRVEKKGHPIYQVRNKLNFILSTNKDKVPIQWKVDFIFFATFSLFWNQFGNVGKKGARRWFVLYVSDKYANKDPSSLAFFVEFLRMLGDNDSFGLRVFDFWLREMDLVGFRPSTVPTTEALDHNIQATTTQSFTLLFLFNFEFLPAGFHGPHRELVVGQGQGAATR